MTLIIILICILVLLSFASGSCMIWNIQEQQYHGSKNILCEIVFELGGFVSGWLLFFVINLIGRL
jgi:nitrogen fixation-related uncharacterized protein